MPLSPLVRAADPHSCTEERFQAARSQAGSGHHRAGYQGLAKEFPAPSVLRGICVEPTNAEYKQWRPLQRDTRRREDHPQSLPHRRVGLRPLRTTPDPAAGQAPNPSSPAAKAPAQAVRGLGATRPAGLREPAGLRTRGRALSRRPRHVHGASDPPVPLDSYNHPHARESCKASTPQARSFRLQGEPT